MFGWGKKKAKEQEPANIHPQQKKAQVPPVKQPAVAPPPAAPVTPTAVSTATKVEKQPLPAQSSDHSAQLISKGKLSPQEIKELRQAEFERLDIPYDVVEKLQKAGVLGLNVADIEAGTEMMNSNFRIMELPIVLTPLEFFNCRVLFLSYDWKLQRMRKAGVRDLPPQRNLMQTALILFAEAQIRKRHGWTEEQPSDPAGLKTFYEEVDGLCVRLLRESDERQLRKEAQRRWRRQNNQRSNVPVPETEGARLMEEIKAEKKQPSRR